MMLASTTSPGVPTQEDLKAYGDTATRLNTPKGFVSRTSSAFFARGARAKEYFRRVLIVHPYMMSNKRSVTEDGWFLKTTKPLRARCHTTTHSAFRR